MYRFYKWYKIIEQENMRRITTEYNEKNDRIYYNLEGSVLGNDRAELESIRRDISVLALMLALINTLPVIIDSMANYKQERKTSVLDIVKVFIITLPSILYAISYLKLVTI